MPIYEYVCEQCGRRSEALRKMDEADAPLACEGCGSERTKRAHSVFAAGGSENAPDVSLPTGAPAGGGCACGDPTGPCNF